MYWKLEERNGEVVLVHSAAAVVLRPTTVADWRPMYEESLKDDPLCPRCFDVSNLRRSLLMVDEYYGGSNSREARAKMKFLWCNSCGSRVVRFTKRGEPTRYFKRGLN